MMRGFARTVAPYLIAILLPAGAAVLSVLQIRWVNAASRAEEERTRANLTRGAAIVLTEAEDEVRVLLSLFRLRTTDTATHDVQSVAVDAGFWYESARFPAMLRAVYVVPPSPSGAAMVYSREKGDLIPVALSDAMRTAIADAESQTMAPGFRPWRTLDDGTSLAVIASYTQLSGPQSSDAATGRGLVAIVLDTELLYTSVVPALAEQHLEGFPYRILDRSAGRVLATSAGPERSRAPEIVVGLDSLLSLDTRFPFPRNGTRPEGTSAQDPSMLFWLLRGRTDRAPPTLSESAKIVLEVFHPYRSLQSAIAARRALEIAYGGGIILVLLGSVAVLYTLYRRTAALRANEQEFVASMSHELRTPISVLNAMSDNLAEGVVTSPSRLPRYARIIREQAKRLSETVESILVYSGLQKGADRPPCLAEVDLSRLLQEVSSPLTELAERRGSTLRVTEESLPPVVCADATALRIIIENLVTNAIRHADPGEIRLNVARRAFDILRIVVEDDGPGIPARDQQRMFDAFVRGERSVREQKPGSGLGLHLVKRVVAALGGSVTLESPYPNLAGVNRLGCRFTVTLPCKERCGHES